MRYGDETAASQVHKTWKWNQLGSRFEGKKSSNDDHRVRHSKRVSRENTTRRVKQWMRIAQPGESSSVDKKRPRSRTYRQLQQPLGYYDGSSVFSLPSPSTNERERRERTGQQCRKPISSSTSSFFEPWNSRAIDLLLVVRLFSGC